MQTDPPVVRDICAICRDHIVPGQLYVTLCQHTFCKTDITRCRNCPICRQPLVLTASAAALATSLRGHRDLMDAVLLHARRAVDQLGPSQGAAEERTALETVERLLQRVHHDADQWNIQHDIINVNQFVMLAHTPVVPVLLWSVLLAVVTTDSDNLTNSLCQLDDAGDELSRWLLDYIRHNIDWARRAAEVQYEINMGDGNLTRAAGRMWEWKRSSATQTHVTQLSMLVDDVLLSTRPLGGRRSKRDVINARQRTLRARHILLQHSFAVTMLQLAEQLRFTVVQLGIERDAVPLDVAFFAHIMTPPDENANDDANDDGEEGGVPILGFRSEFHSESGDEMLQSLFDTEFNPAAALSIMTTTTRVTRGRYQR